MNKYKIRIIRLNHKSKMSPLKPLENLILNHLVLKVDSLKGTD